MVPAEVAPTGPDWELKVWSAARTFGVAGVFLATLALAGAAGVGDKSPLSPLTSVTEGVALLGLILFPAGAYFAATGFYNRARAHRASSWPTARGTVLSSGIAQTYASTTIFHIPKVRYAYRIGDRAFEGDAIQFGKAGYVSEPVAQAIVDRHPPGSAVEVRYDPRDPSTAVLEIRDDAARRAILVGALMFAGPLVLGPLFVLLNRIL